MESSSSDYHQMGKELFGKADENDLSVISNCYCPHCTESRATTTLLPTTIPYFRQIVIMSLSCPHCHFRNSEVTFGGEMQEEGARICLHVTTPADLERQLVKSDSATLYIPQLEFEIPSNTQRGSISTLEGFLKRAASNLNARQPERLKAGDLDNFHRCQTVIESLQKYCRGEIIRTNDNHTNTGEPNTNDTHQRQQRDDEEDDQFPSFDVILDDPAGNSFIENLYAPRKDPHLTILKYVRTPAQDMALGLQPSEQAIKDGRIDDQNQEHKNHSNGVSRDRARMEILKQTTADKINNINQQHLSIDTGHHQNGATFETPCPSCHRPAQTDMCLTDIPSFKEIILMSLLCDHCGYRSSEVKAGGAIPSHGTKIALLIRCEQDLKREVIVSDTACIAIPDIELEEGGLGGGVYTTVEGVLKRLWDRLKLANPFAHGDSSEQHHLTNNGEAFSEVPMHERYRAFLAKLKDIGEAKVFPIRLVVDDPLSNSFVGPAPKDELRQQREPIERNGDSRLCYNDIVDDGLRTEIYDRTFEQNETLGLNDIKTENYVQSTATESPQAFGDTI